ncbi:MAG: hypothetical protein WCJ76_16835, partial [Comamonadaceae bacterium]
MTISEPTTRQIRRAQARQSHPEQTQILTEEIMAHKTASAAAKAKALTLTQGQLTEAELQAWQADYEARLQTIHQHPEQNLGHIEEALADAVKEPLRLLAERAAQAKINATACQCRTCQRQLTHLRKLLRVINSRFGPLTLWRDYGWCPHCKEWQFPADYALGLAKNASASPYIQEISALLVTKMPAEQAVPVAQRLGLDLSRCLLHDEAHRQGLKAQERRAQSLAQLDTWSDL